MLQDLLPYLGAIGGLFGIVGVFGAAYAVLRANVSERTIALWKEQAAALEERLQTEHTARAEERTEFEQRVTKAEAHAEACEQRLATVEELVRDAMAARPRARKKTS